MASSPSLQKKPLQTGFAHGMEIMLGVTEDARTLKAQEVAAQLEQPTDSLPWPEVAARSRLNTQAADLQSEEEGEQGLRDRERYRRMYWESVSEGEVCCVRWCESWAF